MKSQLNYIWLFVAFLAAWPYALADDVYNFYFQKGQGPSTVIQGGGGQTAKAPKKRKRKQEPEYEEEYEEEEYEEEPETIAETRRERSKVATPKEDQQETKLKHYRLNFGIGGMYSSDGSHFYEEPDPERPGKKRGIPYVNIGAQYNFSRYIALDGQLLYSDRVKRGTVSLGLVITPLHLSIFGHDTLDLGLMAGVMSSPDELSWTSSDVHGYWGLMASVNFSPQVSGELRWRSNNQNENVYSQTTLGIAVSF